MAYYEGEVAGLGYGNCNNNDGMFSGGWGGLIGLIAVAALFGWGNGGFGFGGNNGAVTRADLCEEMGFNNLDNSVRGVQQGLCDGFYAMNTGMLNGFAGVQQTLCQGFGGLNTSVLTSANATQNAITNLGYQLQSCCCDLGRGQDRISCEIATSTNAIVQSGKDNTQRILDFLCNEKIGALQAENSLLTAQLSQNSQTQTLLNAINRTPSAAYVVPNPYTGSYGYGYGYGNNGCGCGCGCGCNN